MDKLFSCFLLRSTTISAILKVQDSDLALEPGLGRHHFHDLLGRVGPRIDIVDGNDQITRENVALQTAALLDRVDGGAVLGGVNDNFEFAGWGVAVAADNGRLVVETAVAVAAFVGRRRMTVEGRVVALFDA